MADGEGSSGLTAQQERFCQFVAQGLNQADAYRKAGYKCKDDAVAAANASRLIANAKVTDRVAELRAKVASDADITLAWLQEQAKGILAAARAAGAHAAATGALRELGILTGHRVEKRDNTIRNITDPSDATDDELRDIAFGGGKGAAAPAGGSRLPH